MPLEMVAASSPLAAGAGGDDRQAGSSRCRGRGARTADELADVFDLGAVAQGLDVLLHGLGLALVEQEGFDGGRAAVLSTGGLRELLEHEHGQALGALADAGLAILHLGNGVEAVERQLLGSTDGLAASEADVVGPGGTRRTLLRLWRPWSLPVTASNCSGLASIWISLQAVDAAFL